MATADSMKARTRGRGTGAAGRAVTVAAEPPANLITLNHLIERMRPEIARALPKHMDADKLARVAMTLLRTDPDLAQCSGESFLGALMLCAQVGLEPGPLQEVAIIPRFSSKMGCKEATFLPMYRGLVKLAKNSGQISLIYAEAVYANDTITQTLGAHKDLHHTPAPLGTTRGDVIGFYAVVIYKDGAIDFEVMDLAEVHAIRDRGRNKSKPLDGPWRTDPVEMGKKTPLRRLCKRLPMSTELAAALDRDETTVRGVVTTDDLSVPVVREQPVLEPGPTTGPVGGHVTADGEPVDVDGQPVSTEAAPVCDDCAAEGLGDCDPRAPWHQNDNAADVLMSEPNAPQS